MIIRAPLIVKLKLLLLIFSSETSNMDLWASVLFWRNRSRDPHKVK